MNIQVLNLACVLMLNRIFGASRDERERGIYGCITGAFGAIFVMLQIETINPAAEWD